MFEFYLKILLVEVFEGMYTFSSLEADSIIEFIDEDMVAVFYDWFDESETGHPAWWED